MQHFTSLFFQYKSNWLVKNVYFLLDVLDQKYRTNYLVGLKTESGTARVRKRNATHPLSLKPDIDGQ